MCVSVPRLLKTIHMKQRPNNRLNKFYYFSSFLIWHLPSIVNGRGLSNEVCRELLPKKTNAVLAVHLSLLFYQLYNTNKTERFSFKRWHAVQIAELTYKRRLPYTAISKNFGLKLILDRCTQHQGVRLRMHACNLYGHVGSIQKTYTTTTYVSRRDELWWMKMWQCQ